MNNGKVASFFDNSIHGEDSLLIIELSDKKVLDVVFDGVTVGNGKFASQFAMEVIRDAAIQSLDELINTLQETNRELFRKSHGNTLTTISAALKVRNTLHVINAGDSPVYLIRNKKISEFTKQDRGPLPNIIVNAIGIMPVFKYNYKKITLRSNDKLILATDGITDNIYPKELLQIVQKADSPDKALQYLVNLIKEKRGSNKGRNDFYGFFKEDDRTAIIRYL